jgi:LysR family transcriptional regulator for bpeEF and oprC
MYNQQVFSEPFAMDQLLAMRAFGRVVEAGSFTRAAESLDMPNATMSKLVQELEAHLGVKLLQRTTRRVTVTAEGQDYYAKATRVLRDLEDIDSSFSAAQSKPRGNLRVDVGGLTAREVLIPLLPDFMARYPDIRIDLGVADRAVDLIGDNVDCVIRGGPLDNSSLVARSIGEALMVTCAAPGYLKQYGVPAYPEELRNGHRLIGYISTQTGRAMPLRFEHKGEQTEFRIEHRIGIGRLHRRTRHCANFCARGQCGASGRVTRGDFEEVATALVSVSCGVPAESLRDASSARVYRLAARMLSSEGSRVTGFDRIDGCARRTTPQSEEMGGETGCNEVQAGGAKQSARGAHGRTILHTMRAIGQTRLTAGHCGTASGRSRCAARSGTEVARSSAPVNNPAGRFSGGAWRGAVLRCSHPCGGN